MLHRKPILVTWTLCLALLLAACTPVTAAPTTAPDAPLPEQAPPLPFADNPDPALCGIPERDGRSAVATGKYEGELVQPIVYLYDSHMRRTVTGQVHPGTRLHVELRQNNPTLNYYFVRTVDVEPEQSGWIPAPFVEFPDS
jgi:hypothetical protein